MRAVLDNGQRKHEKSRFLAFFLNSTTKKYLSSYSSADMVDDVLGLIPIADYR